MKLPKATLAILALISANVIWGASPPIFKWALADVPPFTFIFIRFFLATLMLLPFTIHKLHIKRHDIPKVIVLAYVGFTLHITTVFMGLTLAPSVNASIISSAAPIFLIIGSYFMLREKLKRRILIGTIVSLLGVLMIVIRPIVETGYNGELLGNLLFILGVASFVLYTILFKEFKLPYSPLTLTFWIFTIATITFFPLYLWESHLTPPLLSTQALTGILFGAIFTANIAYMLFNFAIRYIPVNEVGVFLYVDPIVTVLIAVPLLGEQITTTFLFGSFLVFVGIFIAEKRLHYHPLQKLRKNRG